MNADERARESGSTEESHPADNDEGLERHPDPDEFPSDAGVQAERQEEGMQAEWEHE